jgi:hypothetical protein
MNIARNSANEFESSRQPIVGFIKHLNDKILRESANVKFSKLDINVGLDRSVGSSSIRRRRRTAHNLLPQRPSPTSFVARIGRETAAIAVSVCNVVKTRCPVDLGVEGFCR